MTAVEVAPASIETVADDHDPPTLLRRLLADRSFLLAASFVAIVVIGAVFAGVLAPSDPLDQNLSHVLEGPSAAHWLGTDELGRDVLSRMLFAARVSLKASVLAVSVALLLGFPIGLLIGYRGGRLESAVMRLSDGLMAMPGLIIVIAVIGIIGNGLVPAMVALGLVLAPVVLRLTRGIALGLRNEPYVDSAQVLGMRTPRVVDRHLLPHVLPALVVQTSLLLGVALLVEAGLSFIGLGVQPPEAGWGSMLTKGASLFRRQAFVLVPPGVAITLTVLAFNVLGDTIRDALTPAPSPAPHRPPRPPTTSAGTTRPALVPDPDHALVVDRLTVAFGDAGHPLVAVDDVSFAVRRGATLGLVGESGCGKSVTALACMGLLPPAATVLGGAVHLGATTLTSLREPELCAVRGSDIAMVFQDPSSTFDPTYTVGFQIGESLRLHRGLSKRAAEAVAVDLLDLVGIRDPRRTVRSFPHQFSGGMLQRVAIAAALACEPSVLIADEPTTAST
ncbi:MAG: dipeptide/oligopeptide/nickel ABC transporter permease/ATP-binding protein [Ilumatobacteraceae bacterium]